MTKIVSAVLSFALFIGLCGCSETPEKAAENTKKSIITGVKNEIEKMNKKGATTDESGTVRTDKTEFVNDTAVYHQTLLTISAADVSDAFVKSMKNEITASVCSNEDTMKVINAGVGIEYNYSDKKGKSLFKLNITKAACVKPR